jgi:pilus assembly protein CpaF
MMLLCHNVLAGQRNAVTLDQERITIGRGTHNDVVLESPLIAFDAAILSQNEGAWHITPLGRNGCVIDGQTILCGDSSPVGQSNRIELFPFEITFEGSSDEKESVNPLSAESSDLLCTIHRKLLGMMDIETEDRERRDNPEYQLNLEHMIEQLAVEASIVNRLPLVDFIAAQCVKQTLIESLFRQSNCQRSVFDTEAAGWSRLVSSVSHRERDLSDLVERFSLELELKESSDLSVQMDRIETDFEALWFTANKQLVHDFVLYLALRSLKKQVKDIVFGYGPLEDLLRVPTISEIMVVDSNHIFVEKKGVVEDSGRRFVSDDVTLSVIDRIVSKVGRRIDKSQPLVDARLTDGSRVNAVIPPLAVSGPCITIRKFPQHRMKIDSLIDCGALSSSASEFLKACVLARSNILIAGGTGTGKTTLLNCLTDFIPTKERIVTIEDTAELQINKEHVVRMEVKQANAEGAGAYTIHDLVKNSLRMRPDRIIVGECRGGEALDMLQAMNTGHEGSLTTIHANSPKDVQLRLEVMVRTAADLPVDSIHRQIASAVDLIVQLTRCRDGRRRITKITEVVGMDRDQGGVRMKDIFHLEGTEDSQELVPTGSLPTFIEQLLTAGYDLGNFYC